MPSQSSSPVVSIGDAAAALTILAGYSFVIGVVYETVYLIAKHELGALSFFAFNDFVNAAAYVSPILLLPIAIMLGYSRIHDALVGASEEHRGPPLFPIFAKLPYHLDVPVTAMLLGLFVGLFALKGDILLVLVSVGFIGLSGFALASYIPHSYRAKFRILPVIPLPLFFAACLGWSAGFTERRCPTSVSVVTEDAIPVNGSLAARISAGFLLHPWRSPTRYVFVPMSSVHYATEIPCGGSETFPRS